MNILFIIIISIFCILIGVGLSYYFLRPSRLEIYEKNRETESINDNLEKRIQDLNGEREKLNQEVIYLQAQKDTLNTSIEEQRIQAEQFAKTLYDEKIALANEKIDRASEELSKKYQNAEEEYKQEYLTVLEDMITTGANKINEQQQELLQITEKLKQAKEKQSAIINLLKREEEKQDNINFYTLQLSNEDLREINKLREVVPYLRNVEPLNKVIWKSYYEKPFTDLVGRLIGSKVVCGIYKITNLENQKVYIGQSVNIKERLRTHIKRGLGAETPTRNKLYTVMNKVGVENFSYEIIEECPREQLNEKECYWIDYFESQNFGYNETKGGS